MSKIIKYKQAYKILSTKEKKLSMLAIFLSSISGLFDLIGISSILPLLTVLINPGIIYTNSYLLFINSKLDLSQKELIIFFAFTSFTLVILNQFFRLLSNWFILYLSENLLFNKSKNLFYFYLVRDYKFFLKSNISHIVQKCTNYVNATVAGFFTPILIIISQAFTLFFIIIFLLIYEPIVTLTLSIIIFIFYFLFYLKLKNKISILGKTTPNFFHKSSRIITDTFETFKEFKLAKNKYFFINSFIKFSKKYKDANILINLFQQFPSFVIEIFSYSIILILTIYFYFFLDNFNEIIPVIGIVALSLRRLIPASQLIYTQISQINFYQESFKKIITDLVKASNYKIYNSKDNLEKNSIFNTMNKIEFKNILFKYKKKNILNNFSLVIQKGTFLGLTGLSGQGKTTFLDLFSGLLKPNKGNILIDDKIIKNLDDLNWQEKISFAPQKSYLLNASVLRNICFDDLKVNIKKVKKICKIVEIKNFIEKDLPQKYDTILGEGGYRLSGGQTQRINLARCLYSNPKILILDEATNSIDSITEKKIINNIRASFKNITIIFVTHRINILSLTDKILLFNNGSVQYEEKFSTLKKRSTLFKNLIKSKNKK